MNKKQRTWGFAALVAIVVGFALYDYNSFQREEKAKETQSLLLSLPAEQISELIVSREKGEIHLKRDRDGWRILKPVNDLADQSAANEFVEGLVTEKSSEIAVEGSSIQFADFGLDSPKGTITIVDQAGKRTQFSVGSRKNFQGDAFLRKNQEDKVLIASSTWFAKLDKTPLDFRDKRLMRPSNSLVERVLIGKGKESFELVRKEGTWILSSHPDWKLDQNRVRELLAMLNMTQAIEFIADGPVSSEELAKWGLVNPRVKLTVDLKGQKQWTAQFATGPDNVHRVQVSDPNVVLKISPTDSDKFFQMVPGYFRDYSEPFQFQKDSVRQIQIKTAGGIQTLKPDEGKAKDLINKVGQLEIYDFAENKSAKLDHEIMFKDMSGKEIFKLQWGNLHKIKHKGTEESVFDAKTSAYSKGFKILENDISSLNLNDKKSPGTDKEKEK